LPAHLPACGTDGLEAVVVNPFVLQVLPYPVIEGYLFVEIKAVSAVAVSSEAQAHPVIVMKPRWVDPVLAREDVVGI
jgi:hypothetical protein